MADTSDIRNGLTINFKSGIWTIVEFLHVKPGKGPAFVRTKLKNIKTGKVIDNTFPSGHKLDVVRVERQRYQFLYREGQETYIFMNMETYEQMSMPKDTIPNVRFLMEEMECELLINTADDAILTVDIPATVKMKVTYTEPGLKGDTATNTLKPATLESGAEVRVPLFINIDDMVKINTSSGEYMERIKQ